MTLAEYRKNIPSGRLVDKKQLRSTNQIKDILGVFEFINTKRLVFVLSILYQTVQLEVIFNEVEI